MGSYLQTCRYYKLLNSVRNLAPFLQFKNVKSTHGAVLLLEACDFSKSNTLHECFSRFLNCTNDTELLKAPCMFKVHVRYIRITSINVACVFIVDNQSAFVERE